jgi:hypothetical protein
MLAIITQTDSVKNINNLIESIYKNWIVLPDIFVSNFTSEIISSNVIKIYELKYSNVVPLSAARNRLIRHFKLENNKYYSHFLYLDDDCWFEDKFDSNKLKSSNNYIGIARSPCGRLLHSLNLNEFNCAISINLIVSSNFITYFDESLGLGSSIAAGEDWDYFLKLSKLHEFVLTTDFVVVHESFRKKILNFTYAQLSKKAKSEALALKHIASKYPISTTRFIVRAIFKSLFPFGGFRFMFKNLCFLYYYAR